MAGLQSVSFDEALRSVLSIALSSADLHALSMSIIFSSRTAWLGVVPISRSSISAFSSSLRSLSSGSTSHWRSSLSSGSELSLRSTLFLCLALSSTSSSSSVVILFEGVSVFGFVLLCSGVSVLILSGSFSCDLPAQLVLLSDDPSGSMSFVLPTLSSSSTLTGRPSSTFCSPFSSSLFALGTLGTSGVQQHLQQLQHDRANSRQNRAKPVIERSN